MAEYIKALVGKNDDFMLIISNSKSVVEKIREIHGLNPVSSAACGRLITGTKLMALSLKEEGARINVDIDGDGDIGRIISFADRAGVLKIKVLNPEPEIIITPEGKLDVGHAVGKNGFVTVTRDSDTTKAYTGKSKLVSGEIAEDLAAYYAESEQQACAVALGVFVRNDSLIGAAGGLMIHVLPESSEEELSKLENIMNNMKPITNYLQKTDDLEEIIFEIFGTMKYKIIEKGQYEFKCDCSKKRAERALASIDEEEKKQIIKEEGSIKLHCDYCNTDYSFT